MRIGPGTAAGPADPELTVRGRAQADRLAAWLATVPVDVVLSSPLRRARETAEPLGRTLGLGRAKRPAVSTSRSSTA